MSQVGNLRRPKTYSNGTKEEMNASKVSRMPIAHVGAPWICAQRRAEGAKEERKSSCLGKTITQQSENTTTRIYKFQLIFITTLRARYSCDPHF